MIKGLSPPSLLETYTEERLPVIAEMLKLTTVLLDKSVAADRDSQAKSWERGSEYFQLGVNYRGSRITLDEDSSGPREANPYGSLEVETVRPGDRAPDAPELQPLGLSSDPILRLFDIFRPHYHTVLIFAKDSTQATPIGTALEMLSTGIAHSIVLLPSEGSYNSNHRGVDRAVIDTQGHAYDAYGAKKGQLTIVIVRPDAVVGAIVRDVDGLQRYFRMILYDMRQSRS